MVVAAEAGRTPVDEADEEEGESSSDWDDSLIMGEEDPLGTASILVEIEKNNTLGLLGPGHMNILKINIIITLVQLPCAVEA